MPTELNKGSNALSQFWIGAKDVPRLRAFYEAVFGWRFDDLNQWDWGKIHTGAGVPGSYGPRRLDTDQRIGLSFAVDDLEATLEAAVKSGGTVVVTPWQVSDDVRDAVFTDPEGTRIELLHFSQSKPGPQSAGADPDYQHPKLDFDGGLIDVLYDSHETVLDWYRTHLGLEANTWDGPSDANADARKFSTLKLPGGGQFHLYSVLTRKRLAHWYSERGTVDSNVRFAFGSPDLVGLRDHLTGIGTRVSDIAPGPGGREYFDFYAPEGTRLTAVGFPEEATAGAALGLTHFAPWCVGVSNLDAAVGWYGDNLGLTVTEDDSSHGWVQLEGWVWVEQLPPGAWIGSVDGAARPYLECRDRGQYTALHERLIARGVQTSPYMGNPEGRWSSFHFYDPDGNRINLWSYY